MINFKITSDNKSYISKYTKPFEFICSNVEKTLDIKKDKVLDISFITGPAIRKLNKKYRKIDKETDVLSFTNTHDILIGEIFIAYDFAQKESLRLHTTLDYEICLLFTHGLLHLLGYDHDNKIKEKNMFNLQERLIENIISKNENI
ncbi:MAG: hypothetical protein Ta2E_03080 [Mycoplasmoidaceae bacterium]|nr:MAG: hypothetical protein Ta2E_03080 [Mycoplasmoidaceae bacterium]